MDIKNSTWFWFLGVSIAIVVGTIGVLEWLEHRHPTRPEVEALAEEHDTMRKEELLNYSMIQQQVGILEVEQLEKEQKDLESKNIEVPASVTLRKDRALRQIERYEELERSIKDGG